MIELIERLRAGYRGGGGDAEEAAAAIEMLFTSLMDLVLAVESKITPDEFAETLAHAKRTVANVSWGWSPKPSYAFWLGRDG